MGRVARQLITVTVNDQRNSARGNAKMEEGRCPTLSPKSPEIFSTFKDEMDGQRRLQAFRGCLPLKLLEVE